MYAFDYAGRLRAYQEKLKAEGVSVGFVMRPGNLRYLTGFWGYATRAEYFEPRRLICLAVPQSGRPLLVTPKIEHEFARCATTGLDIEIRRHVEWHEQGETEDSWGLVRGFMGGGPLPRIAIDRQQLTIKALAAIEAAFPKSELVDGSGWIERMREIKDPVEIALMRRCGELAVSAYEVQVEALRKGNCREFDLALIGLHHVAEQCAGALHGTDINSPLGEGVQLITSGPRLARAHGSASCRRIEPDDVVMFDYCRVPYLLGYRMAMGRVVSQRALSSEEKEIDATIAKSYDAAMRLLKPGVTCSELDSTIRGVLVDGGLAPYIVHRNGRGVGIEAVELPEIKEGVDERIRAGMIISIEPSIYREGFAARIENTLLVTDEGYEVLTRAPTGARVIQR